MTSAPEVVEQLRALALPAELPKVRKRLRDDEEAFGLRMRDVFDTAKAHTDLELDEVGALLDHPAYEPRLVAFCILDFKARGDLGDEQRGRLRDLYVTRHDRITTWDMVDRAAPRVVGRPLLGGPYELLHDLAAAEDALRRRTAITAPLAFLFGGGEADLAEGFVLAERLLDDPDPVVHKAVGIFLKHAGSRWPERLHAVLSAKAGLMPRAGLRLAIEKLPPVDRSRYLAR